VAIDNISNAFFGIFVVIWSSFFVESWKDKQKIIKFFWALDSSVVAQDDERAEDFKYSRVYNDVTFGKEKVKVKPPSLKVFLY
jgi:hypothetical protein